MKKKALLIFTLIFWMVAACTFLSMKVEEEMIPQVTSMEPDRGAGWDKDPTLPADCIIEDENGQHVYSIYEGTGWEAGTRAAEVSGWFQMEDKIMLGNAWGDFVQYSSKPLREGELLEVIRGGDKVEDRWLAVFPEGLELGLNWDGAELPKGVSVEEWNQNAVQLHIDDDLAPFMQGRAKSRVPYLTGATVYSFNDMYQLLDNFTAFGLLLGILTLVLVLWIASCAFSKRPRRSRWVLWANLALGLLLLVCVPIVLDSVDLPSSLLPRERITDFGAITGAMDQFFGALKGFSRPISGPGALSASLPKSEAGQAIIMAKNDVLVRPVLYAILGALLGGVIALVEYVALWHVNRPRITKGRHHAGAKQGD